jgi:penicillin-binding protein 1A
MLSAARHAANGRRSAPRGTRINDTIPLEELPDVLIKATLATEDRRA